MVESPCTRRGLALLSLQQLARSADVFSNSADATGVHPLQQMDSTVEPRYRTPRFAALACEFREHFLQHHHDSSNAPLITSRYMQAKDARKRGLKLYANHRNDLGRQTVKWRIGYHGVS
jgi:hypothetical protein